MTENCGCGLILEFPASNGLVIQNGLPAGGADGQVLAKASDESYDAEWIDPPSSVPTGGIMGQVLTKPTSIVGDMAWEDPVIGKGDGTKSAMTQGAKGASGDYSFAMGKYTEAWSDSQYVAGKYNVADVQTDTFTGNGTKTSFTLSKYIPLTSMGSGHIMVKVNGTVSSDYSPVAMPGQNPKSMIIFNTAPANGDTIEVIYPAETYAEIIGNGTGDNARSNARTLDWDGNETLAGSLTLGSTTITEAQLIALLAML